MVRYKNNFISQEVYSFRLFGLKTRTNPLASTCTTIILTGEERERKRERESSFKQSTANYTFILLISLISPMFLYQLVVTNDILLHFKEGFLYRHIDCLHPNYALCSLTVYIAWCVNTLCIYTYTMTNAAHMLSVKELQHCDLCHWNQ